MWAPRARVASILERGASSGITMVARAPTWPGGDGGGLRVVAGRIGDHAAGKRLRGQGKDQVRGSADLECAAALEVLAFEEGAHAGFGVEPGGSEDRRAARQRPDPFRRRAHVGGLNGEGHLFEDSAHGGCSLEKRQSAERVVGRGPAGGQDYLEMMLYNQLPEPGARGTKNHICLTFRIAR